MLNNPIQKAQEASGWPTDDYGVVLYALVRALRPRAVVEIGTYKGFATLCMAKGLDENDMGTIFTYDKTASFEIPVYCKGRIKYSIVDSGSKEFEESIGELGVVDMAYIDGNHSYNHCKHDFQVLVDHVNPMGGIIVLHDSDKRGVKQVVDELKFQKISLPTFSGLTVVQKGSYDVVGNLKHWGIT